MVTSATPRRELAADGGPVVRGTDRHLPDSDASTARQTRLSRRRTLAAWSRRVALLALLGLLLWIGGLPEVPGVATAPRPAGTMPSLLYPRDATIVTRTWSY